MCACRGGQDRVFVLAMVSEPRPELQIKAGMISGETSQQYWPGWRDAGWWWWGVRETERKNGDEEREEELKNVGGEKGGEMMPVQGTGKFQEKSTNVSVKHARAESDINQSSLDYCCS